MTGQKGRGYFTETALLAGSIGKPDNHLHEEGIVPDLVRVR